VINIDENKTIQNQILLEAQKLAFSYIVENRTPNNMNNPDVRKDWEKLSISFFNTMIVQHQAIFNKRFFEHDGLLDCACDSKHKCNEDKPTTLLGRIAGRDL